MPAAMHNANAGIDTWSDHSKGRLVDSDDQP